MSQASQRLAQCARILLKGNIQIKLNEGLNFISFGMELKLPWKEWRGRCFMIRSLRLCFGPAITFAFVTLTNSSEPLIKICTCGLDVKSSYFVSKHIVVAEISYPLKVLRFITRVS